MYTEQSIRGIYSVAGGDLDGNGKTDLAALTGDGEILLFVADGKGGFTRDESKLTTPLASCRGYHVEMADLDRDGRADLVASFAGDQEGFGPVTQPGCPASGSLRAWRSVGR